MSKAHHPLADAAAQEPSDTARDGGAGRWLSYLAGLGILAVVIFAALHFADERELVRIAKAAEPWWLGVAVVLQAGTYLAQSRCWRAVTRAAKVVLPLLAACKLSLTKLFIDQALPSAGISGSVVVARALERRGIARPVVMATVVVDMIAYYAAYVPALALAVTITVVAGHASPLVIAAALGFVAFSIALMAATLAVSGRTTLRAKWSAHIPALRRALALSLPRFGGHPEKDYCPWRTANVAPQVTPRFIQEGRRPSPDGPRLEDRHRNRQGAGGQRQHAASLA
jgi:uncharacterized membrane protein YbhN (UPF0104 family)